MRLLRLKSAHKELLRSSVQGRLSESDALMWMVLLHTHEIHVRPGTLAEARGSNEEASIVLVPITQRHAASVIAALWPDRKDKRSGYVHWCFEYNTRTPYECWEDVPQDLKPRLLELRSQLEQEPRVLAVVPEA